MARLTLCVLGLLALALCGVAAVSPLEFDEAAVLAELNGDSLLQPLAAAREPELLSLSDLSTDAMALLEADASQSTVAAAVVQGALHQVVAARAVAASHAASRIEPIVFQKLNGFPAAGGVDTWAITSQRSVFNQPKGFIIGNIPAGAQLVIEAYKYDSSKDVNGRTIDEAQYGYGYVHSPASFGGWAGENACGWFPLQRVRKDKADQGGALSKSIPNHPLKCPPVGKISSILAPSNIFKQGTYIRTGGVVKAITKQQCPAFLNYDPATSTADGAAPALPEGAFSKATQPGESPFGTVPAGIVQKQAVAGFGVQYVTKDGKYALVHYPQLDPQNPGWTRYFVDCACLEFDLEAVRTANSPALIETAAVTQNQQQVQAASQVMTTAQLEQRIEAAAQALIAKQARIAQRAAVSAAAAAQADAEVNHQSSVQQQEEAEREAFEASPSDLVAMETQSSARAAISPRVQGRRGNYPGWSMNNAAVSLLEVSGAAVHGQSPDGFNHAVAKNLPPEGPNVKHLTLGEHDVTARLRDVNTGIKKVHVHVYGKSSPKMGEERRLRGLVRRLAAKHTESYRRINALLRKLKRCGNSGSTKCLPRITAKMQDWKAEYLGNSSRQRNN